MRRSKVCTIVGFLVIPSLMNSPYIVSAGGIDPFDEGLDRHIWSLSDQSLQWDGEIARKRREKPIEVERLMKELIEARGAVDEEEEEAYKKVNDAPESSKSVDDDEDKVDDTTESEGAS